MPGAVLFSALEEIRTPNLLIRSSKGVYYGVIASIYQRGLIVPLNWVNVADNPTSSGRY
jgi:hypothetical protein